MCGSASLTSTPRPKGTALLEHLSPAQAKRKPSIWMFFIGLGLIAIPALRINAVVQWQRSVLSTNEGHFLLSLHPGLDNLIYFEIGTDVLLAMVAVVLNILFYARSKWFPAAMMVYVVLTFSCRLLATAMFHSMFPNVPVANVYWLIPYFLWTALTGGYLLLDSRVMAHFKN